MTARPADEGLVEYQGHQISHVLFCLKAEVDVTKTATTSFTRDWDWSIVKTADETVIGPLQEGQSATVNYDIVVNTSSSDSGWAVEGTITIEKNTPFDAELASVTDAVSGFGDVDVDCGDFEFPGTLASGDTLECTYSTALPNGDDRTNTATVTVTEDSDVGGGTDDAAVDFGAPTICTMSASTSPTTTAHLATRPMIVTSVKCVLTMCCP